MTSPTQKIINTLTEGFVKFDDEVFESTYNWLVERYQELVKVKQEYDYLRRQSIVGGLRQYYDKLFAVCGGKGNYRLLEENGCGEQLKKILKIQHDYKILKRNTKIANKLLDLGIDEISYATLSQSTDGFNGYFDVVTTQGTKRIYVDTIIAGGYNIQCSHYRVLVKIK